MLPIPTARHGHNTPFEQQEHHNTCNGNNGWGYELDSSHFQRFSSRIEAEVPREVQAQSTTDVQELLGVVEHSVGMWMILYWLTYWRISQHDAAMNSVDQ